MSGGLHASADDRHLTHVARHERGGGDGGDGGGTDRGDGRGIDNAERASVIAVVQDHHALVRIEAARTIGGRHANLFHRPQAPVVGEPQRWHEAHAIGLAFRPGLQA